MTETVALRFAYNMGYEDGMARKKPDSAKADQLARGTCSLERAPQYGEDSMACSDCGCIMDDYLWANYCPECGAKVKS